jgi:hypothetical protein
MKILPRTISLVSACAVFFGTASTGFSAEVLTQGFLKAEHYYEIPGTAIVDLIGAAKFPDAPDKTFYTGIAGVPQTSPDLNDFGVRITGWVSPTVTGSYRFFLRSDDASQLFINSTAGGEPPDPFTDFVAAEELACCNPFQEPPLALQTSEPVAMTAGQRYGITILMKEGGGGDYVFVAWRNETDTTPAADLQPIPGANLWAMVDNTGRSFNITQQPQSITVTEERTASFDIGLQTTPEPGEYSVQWYKDGEAIPGETGLRYTTPVLAVADSGATYQARMLTLFGPQESEVATLTVVPDTFPPEPSAGALVSTDGTTIDVGVGFDEAVTDATASVAGNYSIADGTITSFTYYPSSQSALLKVTGLAAGASTTVTVQNVADVKGNAISSVTVPVTVSTTLRWDVVGGGEGPGGLAGNYVVPLSESDFDVYSNGIGEWATYDEATFVYEEITGDFDKKAQVVYQDLSSQWARAGIIARDVPNFGVGRTAQTGTAEIPGVAGRYQKVHVNPSGPTLTGPGNEGNNAWEGNRRLISGPWSDPGNATSSAGGGGGPLNYPDTWVRLQRVDQTFTIYRSIDGEEWTQMGSTTWGVTETAAGEATTPMPDTLYVGPEYSPENGNITNEGDRGVWLAQFRNYGDTFTAAAITGFGLNFGADEPDGTSGGEVTASAVAGAPGVAQANWNNLNTLSGSADSLVADAGGASQPITATVEWTSANTWSSTGRGEENNALEGANLTLMTGYLDTGADTTTTVTISGIPEDLTGAEHGYDVYVYALAGVPARGGSYRVVDPSNEAVIRDYIKAQSPTNPTEFVAVPTDDPDAWGVGSYMVFRNLDATNIRIEATTVDPWGFGDTHRAPINAIQLVPATQTPEPQVRFTSIVPNTDGSLTLTWEGGGVLQAAPTVLGPWATIDGATSPYTFTPTQPMLFGRIMVP